MKYNESNRRLTWDIGDLDQNVESVAAFQVSILPSVSQVGNIPSLVTDTRYRSVDRFTGTTLRASAPDVTTAIHNDPRPDAQDGHVQPLDSQ
jgi:hypothetical protein